MLKRIKHIFKRLKRKPLFANSYETKSKTKFAKEDISELDLSKIRITVPDEEAKPLPKAIQPELYTLEIHHNDEIEEFEATGYKVYKQRVLMEIEGNKTIILPYTKLYIEEMK